MAVSVQTHSYPRTGMWNQGDPPAPFPSSDPEGSHSSMSYQYPLAPGPDSPSNMIPSYHHPPIESGQPLSPALTRPMSPSLKSRAGSATSKSSKIKRSISTPNVRGQSTADAAALALDKRRNKLGYHRTSVACGHCRRRKIRCIAAPADPQNRCSNCIRLKKECNFYPVDQQPPTTMPQRRNSKSQSGAERASESSSPSTSSGQVPEMPHPLPYSHMNMPPIQDLGGPHMKRQRTESFSPESSKGVERLEYDYGRPSNISPVVTTFRNFEHPHGTTTWMGPDASPGIKPPPEGPTSMWRVNAQESPINSPYPPYAPNLQVPSAQTWSNAPPEASPREDMGWQPGPPQRSMSYGNLETLPSQPPYNSYSQPGLQPPDHYATKPRILPSSGMYPPPMSSSGSSISGPEQPDSMQPHPGSYLPPVQFSGWQSQGYSYQKPAGPGPEAYGGWNTPSSGGGGNGPQQGPSYGDPTASAMYYPQSQHGR